jgi:hypothetical protein
MAIALKVILSREPASAPGYEFLVEAVPRIGDLISVAPDDAARGCAAARVTDVKWDLSAGGLRRATLWAR